MQGVNLEGTYRGGCSVQEIVELNRRCKRSNRSNLCLLTGAWLISLSLLCNQSSECTVLTFLSQSNFNIHPLSVASLWKKKLATYLEGKRRWYAQLSSHQSEQSASLISALPDTLHRLYQELCRAVPSFAEDISGFIVCSSTAGVRQEPHQAHSSQGDKVATLLLCHYHPPPCYQMELLLWWYRGVLDRQNPEKSSSGPYNPSGEPFNPQGHHFLAPASYATAELNWEGKIFILNQCCGSTKLFLWWRELNFCSKINSESGFSNHKYTYTANIVFQH